MTFRVPTSWGAQREETGPLPGQSPRASLPRGYAQGREVVRKTVQHVFGGPAVSQGHSGRSSHIRSTSPQPPGSCQHSHFTDETTEPPAKALVWLCVMSPHMTTRLAGLEPGLLSPHADATL